MNLSFSDFGSGFSDRTNYLGYLSAPDFVGQEWTSTGSSGWNRVNVSCAYDGVVNYSEFDLDSNRIEFCVLPLDNQAPFVIWDTPSDEDIFPSQSQVSFDASRTWDLDNDSLTFTWESSIDGVFSNLETFTVNDGTSSQIALSDGIHDITLTVCDTNSQCVS